MRVVPVADEGLANSASDLAGRWSSNPERDPRPYLPELDDLPVYTPGLRDVNQTSVTVHGPTPPPLPALSVDEVEAAVADDGVIVDVRGVEAFSAGPVPGSLSIPRRAQFATWLGWLASRGRVPAAVHVELGELADSLEAVPDGPALIHCGHGERTMSAASLLERAERRDVAVLAGGPDDLGALEVER